MEIDSKIKSSAYTYIKGLKLSLFIQQPTLRFDSFINKSSTNLSLGAGQIFFSWWNLIKFNGSPAYFHLKKSILLHFNMPTISLYYTIDQFRKAAEILLKPSLYFWYRLTIVFRSIVTILLLYAQVMQDSIEDNSQPTQNVLEIFWQYCFNYEKSNISRKYCKNFFEKCSDITIWIVIHSQGKLHAKEQITLVQCPF